jgi:hypothetical protein
MAVERSRRGFPSGRDEKADTENRFPGAARHAVLRCRTGIVTNSESLQRYKRQARDDPGSAVHHFVLHRVRETAVEFCFADKRARSRDATRARVFAQRYEQTKKISPNKKGEAERRETHPANEAAHCRSAAARPAGRARLSALHRGSARRCFLSLPAMRLQAALRAHGRTEKTRALPAVPHALKRCTSRPGRHAGGVVARNRPGAVCKSARRHRTRSAVLVCLPEGVPLPSQSPGIITYIRICVKMRRHRRLSVRLVRPNPVVPDKTK